MAKFLPPQHLQPAPWPDIAEKRFPCATLPRAAAAVRVVIAGKHNAARGDWALQLGQAAGSSYCAIGRKSENGPQLGQSYSYFGMLLVTLLPNGDHP